MSTMTLTQVRDEILPHVAGYGPYVEVLVVDMQDWADEIAAHLAQPAQYVDVEMVRKARTLIDHAIHGEIDLQDGLGEAHDLLTDALKEKGNG